MTVPKAEDHTKSAMKTRGRTQMCAGPLINLFVQLAVPVGKEWNAMRAARGFARPAVVTDAGRAIAPMKLTKSRHQAPFAEKLNRS